MGRCPSRDEDAFFLQLGYGVAVAFDGIDDTAAAILHVGGSFTQIGSIMAEKAVI
jgi:hypothetical protein